MVSGGHTGLTVAPDETASRVTSATCIRGAAANTRTIIVQKKRNTITLCINYRSNEGMLQKLRYLVESR